MKNILFICNSSLDISDLKTLICAFVEIYIVNQKLSPFSSLNYKNSHFLFSLKESKQVENEKTIRKVITCDSPFIIFCTY